jgi:aspartate/methionine/tyrosine aminotransferase
VYIINFVRGYYVMLFMICAGYAMTGYRVGWARCSSMLVEQLSKMQEPIVSCGVPFAQEAAIAALMGPQDCVKEMTAAYKERRDAALSVLNCRGRPSSFIPGGAFYLPVDISSSGRTAISNVCALYRFFFF